MKKILVTGGAGFIGSHVCDRLLEQGEQVVCLDNFNDYYSPMRKEKNINHNKINKNFVLEKVDITNFYRLKKVFESHKPEKVIHLAARAGVRPSLEHPQLYEETNVKGTLNLLELSKMFKVKNFVFGSSSSVYGNSEKIPFSENFETNKPLSPYAATKIAGEALCYTYSYLYKLNIICLRFFTVYGPRGRPDMAPYLFTKLINDEKPITVYGDGTSKRDYTYVSDVVNGIGLAIDKNFEFEVFNIGNSKTVELRQLISIIEKEIGKKAKILRKKMLKEDVPLTYADISKSRKKLGYVPVTELDEGIKAFVKWYREEITR